jgi:hypothetical protein
MSLRRHLALALSRCTGRLPETVDRDLWRILRFGKAIPLVRLRGETRTGTAGTMILAGERPFADYLPNCFFAGEPVREPLGHASVWKLPGVLRALQDSADLTVARVDALADRLFFDLGYLRVPEWVGCTLAVPGRTEDLACNSGDLSEAFRLLRKHRYTCRVSHMASDLATFYETMYRPSVGNRFQQAVLFKPYASLLRSFQRGRLLWITREGVPVAGKVIEYEGTRLRFVASGVAGGDQTLRKQGALSACHYHAIEHARQMGCDLLDWGGSRPCLNDGVLRYKMKWGCTLAEERRQSDRILLVKARTVTATVASFLEHTPLLFRDQGGFSSLHAESGAAPGPRLRRNGVRQIYRARIGQAWSAREIAGGNHLSQKSPLSPQS